MSRDMTTTGPTLATPPWSNDYFGRDQLLPGGAKLVAAQFLPLSGVIVTTSAAHLAAVTTLNVNALSGPIPSGTLLDFAGAGKFAKTTAAAAAGATTITVEATDAAIGSGVAATYAGTGRTMVPSGTIVGRTIAERNASTGFGPAGAADDEIYIVAFDVDDVNNNNDVELVRPGAAVTVKENFLPGWSAVAGAVQTLVRAKYLCIRGAV